MEFIYYPKCSTCLKALKQLQAKEYQIVKRDIVNNFEWIDEDKEDENKDLKMIMHISLFDTLGPQATSVEFSLPDTADNSIGAKMASAGANTLMGMGTVFAVLIFISLIISCFKVIPKITEARANKNKKANITTEEDKSETVSANETVDVSDDLELIAVIASAIAASENTSTDSFVVRSIRRR